MGNEYMTDEQLDALEEMSATVAVKGKMLRSMIDEIRGWRHRIHQSHSMDEHCMRCGNSEEQLAEPCEP